MPRGQRAWRNIFGTVGISVVVKEGAPRPDISSKEKFRDAMLSARSVVHATPGKTPSGTHMGKLMEQLGIADAMAKKVILKPALVREVYGCSRTPLGLEGSRF
jgi:ABC-type molybdate transport system substrate-binding protein